MFFSGHTYCDTAHPFIMIISEDTHHTLCRAFDSVAVTTCFNNLVLLRLGFEHTTFRLWGERSKSLRHRRGCTNRLYSLKLIYNRIVLNGRNRCHIFQYTKSFKSRLLSNGLFFFERCSLITANCTFCS